MDFHVTAGFISSDRLPFLHFGTSKKFKVESNCERVLLVGKFYRILRNGILDNSFASMKKVKVDVAITFNNYLNMNKIYDNLCVIVESDCLLYKKDITHDDICEGSCLFDAEEFKFIGPVDPNITHNKDVYEILVHENGYIYEEDYFVCEEVDSITIFENGKQIEHMDYLLTCDDYYYKVVEVMAVDKDVDDFDVNYKFEDGVISVQKVKNSN